MSATPETHETPLLTVSEVADELRVSRATVYRKIAAGELPALRIGERTGPVRVDAQELEQWLYGEAACRPGRHQPPGLRPLPTRPR